MKLDLDSPRVAKIEVFPKNPIVPLPGMKQQMRVLATYTDGAVRDVTREAFIESGNTEVAERRQAGPGHGRSPRRGRRAGPLRRGLRRHHAHRHGRPHAASPGRTRRPTTTIDELVVRQAASGSRSLPSELCTDAEFIRRVYLDLTGLPPTADAGARVPRRHARHAGQARRADRSSWSAATTTSSTGPTSGPTCCRSTASSWASKGAVGLAQLDPQAVASNMPYDQFVYAVLTASGSNAGEPAGRRTSRCSATPEDDDGEHDAAVPGRALQLQQVPRPSVRALDAGPVLPPGGVLRPGRPQGRPGQRRPARSAAPPSKAAKPLVEDRSPTPARAKCKHGGTGKPAAPAFPYRARRPGRRRRLAPRAAGQLDHLEGQPVLRQELRQPPVGLPARRRHHRADRRHPRRQPADAIPSCSTG